MSNYPNDDAIMSGWDFENFQSEQPSLLSIYHETSNEMIEPYGEHELPLVQLAEAALGETTVDLSEHGISALSNATPGQLIKYVPENVLHQLLVEWLHDVPAEQILQWLAEAELLGYEADDVIDENGESVGTYRVGGNYTRSEDIAVTDTALAHHDVNILSNYRLPAEQQGNENQGMLPVYKAKNGRAGSDVQPHKKQHRVFGRTKDQIPIRLDSNGNEMMRCSRERAWKLLSDFRAPDPKTGKMLSSCNKCMAHRIAYNKARKRQNQGLAVV